MFTRHTSNNKSSTPSLARTCGTDTWGQRQWTPREVVLQRSFFFFFYWGMPPANDSGQNTLFTALDSQRYGHTMLHRTRRKSKTKRLTWLESRIQFCSDNILLQQVLKDYFQLWLYCPLMWRHPTNRDEPSARVALWWWSEASTDEVNLFHLIFDLKSHWIFNTEYIYF